MPTPQVFNVDITQFARIELKPEAFTEEFMAEFRQSFFQFDTLKEHAEHIGQLLARGLMDEVYRDGSTEFVEGYGPIGEFVAFATIGDVDVESELAPISAAA